MSDAVPKADSSDVTSASAQAAGPQSAVSAMGAMAVAGFLSAVVALGAIHALGEVFQVSAATRAAAGAGIPGPEGQAMLADAALKVRYSNTAVWIGILGGILGASLGALSAMMKSGRRPLVACVLIGIVVCGLLATGAGCSAVRLELMAHANIPADELSVPEHFAIAMHGGIWLVFGLGTGVAVALMRRPLLPVQVLESAVVCGLAGMLGGLVFPIVAGLLLPATDPATAVPVVDETWGRLLWMSVPCVLIGIAAGRQQQADGEIKGC